jgi:peptide methionine sulfoxide reductase MsrB
VASFWTRSVRGVFTCRLCGLQLFLGGQKFDAGTGGPASASFDSEGAGLARLPPAAG